MKTKKILFSVAIASSLLMTNCVKEDDLNQVDPNVQTADTFWENENDALKGVNAAYGSLLTDGTYMRSTPLLLDLKSDGARSLSPWGAMANVGKFNTSVSDAAIYGWAFETYYQGVYRSNQVLENVPAIEMDEALKNRILGQAHFLRGLYFFHLVNMFKNVPLPLTSLEIYHEQKSQEEGWAQVKADFMAASELLPVSYDGLDGPDSGHKGRATKGAALAYLGKAYLFTQDFTNARNAFEDVINLNVYDLVANYRDNFTTANENNVESIFEVQFNRDAFGVDLGWGGEPSSGWGKTSARAITYAPRAFGWTDVQPTWTLYNDYQIEATIDGEVDPRLDATMFYNKPGGMMLYGHDFATFYANSPGDLNDLFCRKYQNSDGEFADEFDWRSGINERIMRYADVLLMYAECLNETGSTPLAYDYIQMVRDRVNLPDLSVTQPNMTQQQMRDQIAHERFLEFPLEGHRSDDIRRWGWLQDPAKLQWLKDRDPEFQTYVPGREYFPIPQSEMDNNPLVTQQNTGY
ncbi:RagB/SusD family nutrient uptake outer membrane protein [Mangrovimonas sp. AS39]|uniref:RagB/SusD family nutrient uptake outer membrane protein n=1 Tax=Mangrovimonas futianensis TaxID=2895523 RepID=UPI001E3ACD38|nr:RagB/SusD family nutrient uptake outer membrane protein [Mangrovimonas futianensis]MCF1190900.1 RagB/SusD family nutrient uptake outer membrane protein [Mangrovimonas futianensis]MCF1194596.1 RagB/SusD family nutrient uptake outer membrane protein [Mangrovimonas futianensis]MCF1420354.1 RagB/SusD family nutrient uptake outer membrane protein [Mangrovimonas futianensis]